MLMDLSSLYRLTERANELAFVEYGLRNSCIATSAALRDVLRALDVPAEVMRVSATVFPPREAGPSAHCCSLGSDDWGGARRTAADRGKWHGHLAVVADQRFLLDATLDQVRDSNTHLEVGPFVAEVTDTFLRGEESHHADHCACLVRYRAFPGRGGFKAAPAFRPIQRRALVEALLAETSGL